MSPREERLTWYVGINNMYQVPGIWYFARVPVAGLQEP